MRLDVAVGILKVSDAMDEEIVTVDESISVAEAAARISEKRKGCAIVLKQCRPVGMAVSYTHLRAHET